MVLAAAYLGGAYYFTVTARAEEWHTVMVGFVAVSAFASLLGVATVLHWSRFNHDHVAFWLWAGLYFTTPFLVTAAYLANRRHERRPQPSDARIGRLARFVIGATGAAAVALGVFGYVFPSQLVDISGRGR